MTDVAPPKLFVRDRNGKRQAAPDRLRMAATAQSCAGIPLIDHRLRVPTSGEGAAPLHWPDVVAISDRRPEPTDIERQWMKFLDTWKGMKNGGRWPSNIQMLALARDFLRHVGMDDPDVDRRLAEVTP